MFTNRIRRYERLWTESQSQSAAAAPDGFALYPFAQLTPAQQAACTARRHLYQWAYDQARRAADERFVHDWII